ncbi:MAG: hypothetical protein U5L09_10215 [Bacteroidales bacterium]|nr:hypothetical protein [Bacteroidales bacterium]
MNSDSEFKNEVNKIRFSGEEKSERYQYLVYKALSQELISISKASALLGIDVKKVKEQLTLV